jgi:hypothetical protein
VPVYFLKAKQGYTIRKMEKDMDILYIYKCRYEIQEQKEVWYGILVYTGPF